MSVETDCKVTLSVRSESGEVESRAIPLKDFKSPNPAGSKDFWIDVLNHVIQYRLSPETTKQKTLTLGSPEAKKATESLGKKLEKEKKEKKAAENAEAEAPAA